MRSLLVLPLFLLIAACGQSGDLYLPDEAPSSSEKKKAPAPAPAASRQESPVAPEGR